MQMHTVNSLARRAAVLLPAAGVAVLLAGTASAAPAWVITPTVDPSPLKAAFSNVLNAVDARTGTDAWAVGNFLGPNDDDGQVMLAEHWNGTAWSRTPTPNVVRFDEKLNAVSAAGANDVWAVGSTNRTGFAHTDPLAAHWDGNGWTVVPTPATTGGAKSILFGVENLGGGDAWAVGRSEANRALIEHWTGSAWTIVPAPDPVAPAGTTFTGSTLSAVSARSATDIWAVGFFQSAKGTASNSYTFTLHFNGTAWTVVPSPNPATPSPLNGVRQTLNGVTAISASDVWAVGNTVDTVSGSFQPDKPIAMHFNGNAWSLATLPDTGNGSLAAVTASGAGSVWAAGPAGSAAVLHFNGTAWTAETTPVGTDGPPVLRGVSAVPGSATEVWADGFTLPDGGGYHTFAVHHP
ncbi:hypothetical protein [Actinoplanes awajinensis]|uniref:Uncharacterized protein n=1 Tax=Actinoplanes awajinensis subsp. mycoplanecinus TaxID=135947 RepID=A0A0X3UP10_9ACTN|nr:hypothetical protein [Actinoplanes awajinensis]KUL34274.1 hypothetical protein ADL15_16710 [Actinoplanes awajinensis subsp. mycoplanecinus]